MAENAKRLYEAMYLVDSAWATADWDGVIQAINTIMTRTQAEVVNIRKWDERRLCYDMAGRKRGLYILSYFYCLPEKITQIERDVQLNEMLLRVLVLRADHVTPEDMEAPTPALRAQIPAQEEPPPVNDEQKNADIEKSDVETVSAIKIDAEPEN